MTKKQKKITIEDILNEFYLDVEDGGFNYDVIFKNKTNGDVIHIPVANEILDYGDIVAFADGKIPSELTKQEWIYLYLQELKQNKTYGKTKRNKI